MQNIKTIRGDLDASDLRVAIVAARFNDLVVESLIKGALDSLRSHGVDAVGWPGWPGTLCMASFAMS